MIRYGLPGFVEVAKIVVRLCEHEHNTKEGCEKCPLSEYCPNTVEHAASDIERFTAICLYWQDTHPETQEEKGGAKNG